MILDQLKKRKKVVFLKKKTLKKKINNIESKISKLEKEISLTNSALEKNYEKTIVESNFFSKYENMKNELGDLMKMCEDLTVKLD
tara:strand:- start:10229 stop:10483 length:255 start_codon:yes stop_codon:yes gene_type:complete